MRRAKIIIDIDNIEHARRLWTFLDFCKKVGSCRDELLLSVDNYNLYRIGRDVEIKKVQLVTFKN